MVFCSKCGGGAHFEHTTDNAQTYVSKSGEVRSYRRKTYRRLRCDRARRKHECDNGTILNYDVVEATILNEMLPRLVEARDEGSVIVQQRARLAELIRQRDADQARLDNLVDALADGGSKSIVQRVATLETQIEQRNADISEAQRALAIQTSRPAAADDVAEVEALRAALSSEDEDARIYARGRTNMGLRRLIARILLNPDETFRVEPDEYSWWLFDETGKLLEGEYVLEREAA
jgi:hypothetical protein